MNDQLQNYARKELKAGLALCSESQQFLFKRMYSHGNLDLPIDEVVDSIEVDRLDWAMEQVRRTLARKEKANE